MIIKQLLDLSAKYRTKYRISTENFKIFNKILLYSLLALILLPFITILHAAFSSIEQQQYLLHILRYTLWGYLSTSAKLAGGVMVITLALGTSLGWLFSRYDFFARRTLQYLIFMPLAVPVYLAAYSYDEFLSYGGLAHDFFMLFDASALHPSRIIPIRSLYGAIFVMSVCLYPYVYLAAYASFTSQSQSLGEAAKLLGQTDIKIFWQIRFPQAFPALYAGMVLAVLEALNDVGLTEYFGVSALSAGILTALLAEGSFAVAAMLAIVFVVVLLIFIVIGNRVKTSWQKHDINTKRQGKLKRVKISGYKNLLIFFYVMLIIFLGFGIPLAVLIDFAIKQSFDEFDADFLQAFFHSISLGFYGTLLIVAVAVILTFGRQQLKSPFYKTISQLTSIGYSLPGVVLAIGILWLLAKLYEISGFISLIGTIYALLYAYLVRFLPLASHYITIGKSRLNPHLGESAIMLGQPALKMMWQVELPLISRFIVFAAIMVFVDINKELPATLLLRPFNYETLATRLYNYASLGDLETAATAGIALIAINLGATIVLKRISSNE